MDSVRQSGHFETRAQQSAGSTSSGDGAYVSWVKPAIDFVGALLILLILTPVVLISALAVKISLGSPVIYRQKRIGRDGEPFELLKFRTMIPDRRVARTEFNGEDRRKTHKSPGDPRVVPPGPLLRALRFDELPQLWNVLRGDMSLVGPRPELPEIVAGYEEWQHARHEMKPGVTGLWQVTGGDAPMHECTEIDLQYIEDVSFATDLKILLKTPIAMVRRSGF